MKGDINTPHDAFFKKTMNNPGIAKSVLKSVLPAEVYKLIDWKTLDPIQTNFVSDELKETFSDVIYTAKLKNGKEVFITFILEHKSHPDKFTPVQIMYYLASGYYKQYKNDKSLNVIIPLVFYHGKEKWIYKSLEKIFDNVPESLKRFIPAHETLFVDLADMTDRQLEALENSLVTAILMLQKYALFPDELLKKLHLIFEKMNSVKEGNFFYEVIVYSLQLIDEKKVEETLKKLPVNVKNEIMTAYESLIKKGMEKGIQQGMEQGEYIAKTKIIIKGYKKKLSVEDLAELTGLSIEEVIKIIEEHFYEN